MLYHHFGSKAGLYAAVVETTVDVVLERVDAAVAGVERVGERLAAALDALVVLHGEHPNVAQLFATVERDVARHAELASLRATVDRLSRFWASLAGDADPATGAAIRAVVEGFIGLGRSADVDLAAAAGALRALLGASH